MKKFDTYSESEPVEEIYPCGRIGLSRQTFTLEIAGSRPVGDTKNT